MSAGWICKNMSGLFLLFVYYRTCIVSFLDEVIDVSKQNNMKSLSVPGSIIAARYLYLRFVVTRLTKLITGLLL